MERKLGGEALKSPHPLILLLLEKDGALAEVQKLILSHVLQITIN